jgi:hypothetical protein
VDRIIKIKRREFLKAGALVVAGTAAAASGMLAAAWAEEWKSKLAALKPHEAQTLLRMTRQIYPHTRLDNACYGVVVQDLDAEAARDPSVAKLLADGVVVLDRAKGSKFADLSADDQIAVLTTQQDTPFFQKVLGTALVSLYGNSRVWKQLGYQGPSYAFGGYIHHGFNDLNWLPDPPESASPKPV